MIAFTFIYYGNLAYTVTSSAVLLKFHIGAPEEFVGFFMVITQNANSAVILNGRTTSTFNITRSVG
jgi:hypothetical protein